MKKITLFFLISGSMLVFTCKKKDKEEAKADCRPISELSTEEGTVYSESGDH